MSESALVHALKEGRRLLPLPAVVQVLGQEGSLTVEAEQVLRLLPGKRVTVRGTILEGSLQGQSVALKLLLCRRGGNRHRWREVAGYQRLRKAGVACPELLAHGFTDSSRLAAVVYQWVDQAVPLGQAWPQLSQTEKRQRLDQVLASMQRLHRHGAWQRDIHLDNFMLQGDQLVTLDLATVTLRSAERPLPLRQQLANFGQFAAQLEVADQPLWLNKVCAALSTGPGSVDSLQASLWRSTRRAWRIRLKDYLIKSRRACSLTHVESSFWHRWYCRREHWQPDLQRFAADPESFMAAGTRLKTGNTATVVAAVLDGRPVVIKRYNIKSWRHGLSRALRPTRASRSWHHAHLLELIGLPATTPVALLERRWGPLRRQAWFVCDAVDGTDLLDIGQNRALDTAEYESLRAMLEQMITCRISHGDFKANNLLVSDSRIWLIDLDAMRRHRSRRGFERALRRDLARLRRNWPRDAGISRQIEAMIAELPRHPRQL